MSALSSLPGDPLNSNWLSQLLDAQAQPAGKPQRKNAGKNGSRSSYITPPSLRKGNAVQAASVVMAVKVDDEVDPFEPIAPAAEPSLESSIDSNYQPPGTPPLKRSRRVPVPSRRGSDEEGYASSGESAPVRPRRGYAESSSRSSSRRSESLKDWDPSLALAPVRTEEVLKAATEDVYNLMAPDRFSELMAPDPEIAALEAELNDPNLTDASRRKVRHNLTERRRVDRMNQVCDKFGQKADACNQTALYAC
jgi:hypothetical protein